MSKKCGSYGPKGKPLGILVSFHVAVMDPRGDPLKKMCHPMWQIQPQGGTPWKFCCSQCGRYGPNGEPLEFFSANVVAMTQGGISGFFVIQCGRYSLKGEPLAKHFHTIWQLRPHGGTPYKMCVDQCGRYGNKG